MKYPKIANLLDNTSIYSVNGKINFKTSMLRSSLCEYSDAYILARGNISVNNNAAADADANNNNIIVLHLLTAQAK